MSDEIDDPFLKAISQQLADKMPRLDDSAAAKRVAKARSACLILGDKVKRIRENEPRAEAVSCPRCGFEGTWEQFDCKSLGVGEVVCLKCGFHIDTRTALIVSKPVSQIGVKR